MSQKQQKTAFILMAIKDQKDEGGVDNIVISNKDFPKLLNNDVFKAKWECLDPNVTDSVAHSKVIECIIQWCAIHIYRIDRYNELRVVLVERNLFDHFLTTVVWEASWAKLSIHKRCPAVIMRRSLFYQPAQMPFVKILLDSMDKYIVDSTPVLAPEPELEPELERADVVFIVEKTPAEKAAATAKLNVVMENLQVELVQHVDAVKENLLQTQQELHAVKHQFHEAQRLFFSMKDLCEQKDKFYEQRATRDEELLQTALEQTKAFAALYEAREANMEAQDGEGKPWYTGNDDTPEGIFELLQEFPQCDWACDGNVSDVSVTSSEDAEEDAEDDAEEDDEQ